MTLGADGLLVSADGHIVAERLVLAYGPVQVAFTALDSGVRFVAREPHRRFCVTDAPVPDLTLSWEFGHFQPSSDPVVQNGGDVWEARPISSGGEEIVFYETPARLPALRLHIDKDLRRGRVTETPLGRQARDVNVGRYPFDEFVVSRLLSRTHGLLLHASAVILDGAAIVFVGHSGAGKSTISQLMEEAGLEVMTDDRTILTCEGAVVHAWGTPWHGSRRRALARRSPVRAMFLLKQAETHEVSPALAQQTAVKELFVRLIQPRVKGDEVANCLDALAEVTGRVPLRELHFARSSSAATFVLDMLAS
jgi:hypothetical protein